MNFPAGLSAGSAVVVLLPAEAMDEPDYLLIDEEGEFRFEAQHGSDYLLLVIPVSGGHLSGYELHGYQSSVIYIQDSGGEAFFDINLTEGHDFIFEAYEADGSLVDNDGWVGTRFAADMAGTASAALFLGIENKPSGVNVPCTILPPGKPYRFFFQWTVPGFGSIVLPVDNEGRGYTGDAVGATILNLNYELALSQLHRLEQNINKYTESGYGIPEKYFRLLRDCRLIMNKAEEVYGAERAAFSDDACSIALYALEELELARAETDIETYRKGRAVITVVDPSGALVPDALISYKQISHDFLFGIFDTMENTGEEGFRLMKDAGINYSTAGFYWDETEPRQNRTDWSRIDSSIGVKKMDAMGFEIKAHALMAFWDFAVPEYLLKMDYNKFNEEVYEHISALVFRYSNQMDIWNVINEAHGRGAALDFSRDEITGLTMTGIEAIRENDPGSRIIINCSFDWFGESMYTEILQQDGITGFTLPVPAYLAQLERTGVDYDIIGQQMYNGGFVSIFADWGIGEPMGVPSWDLEHLSSIMDELGTYGKPVHITEQSVPSFWDPEWEVSGAGWWHDFWSEEVQAEFLRAFYTIGFSKKNNEAITWWNINDENSFIKCGGLLDEDNKPKSAYRELKSLIDSWMSSGLGKTDTRGRFELQGFGGEYEIIINGDADTAQSIYIKEQNSSEYRISCPE